MLSADSFRCAGLRDFFRLLGWCRFGAAIGPAGQLNPHNGSSWSNDTSTVNSSSGRIDTYGYNSTGMRTDEYVKYGESGTAYYVAATDFGDSTNPYIATASYDYPTQTTTRSTANQTTYTFTFYDTAHQQPQTKTTTLPT